MAIVSNASVHWDGDLASGRGRVSSGTSGAFSALPVSWASRTESSDGRTSPEELLAAAHASCFSMALSSELAKAGATPGYLDVTADVTFDRVDGRWTVVSSRLTVRGHAGDLDEAQFRSLAEAAKEGCPISRALKGNVALSVDAFLEPAAARS
jgi:osmotically inducible protein OsmC